MIRYLNSKRFFVNFGDNLVFHDCPILCLENFVKSFFFQVLNEERNVVAFFYEKLDKVATKIIAGLTKVEEHFTGQDITFINIDVNDVQVSTVWKNDNFTLI